MAELARRAARISPTATDVSGCRRAACRAELKPLVVAINGALERLDEGFRMQREFTADAAHELRTPLAILATNLDSMDDRQVAAALREDVDAHEPAGRPAAVGGARSRPWRWRPTRSRTSRPSPAMSRGRWRRSP